LIFWLEIFIGLTIIVLAFFGAKIYAFAVKKWKAKRNLKTRVPAELLKGKRKYDRFKKNQE
jgi:hypothetical protein